MVNHSYGARVQFLDNGKIIQDFYKWRVIMSNECRSVLKYIFSSIFYTKRTITKLPSCSKYMF